MQKSYCTYILLGICGSSSINCPKFQVKLINSFSSIEFVCLVLFFAKPILKLWVVLQQMGHIPTHFEVQFLCNFKKERIEQSAINCFNT